MSGKKKNLDAHLAEIFTQFIAIKDKDFKRAQEVFKVVFDKVKTKMEEQCNFFKKYSSQIMYAGSVYDSIKVSKMDEFDMDIVIRLPIDQRDDSKKGVIIENDQPGFVRMRIYDAFDNMDKQPEWEKCHVVTKDWRDSEKYFLQNKFRHWLHRIVQRALNEMNNEVEVNGVNYLVKYKESGPAFTLNIRNKEGDEKFCLDVDLVPVIRFQCPRWPKGYRAVSCQSKDWLVVPKPNKALKTDTLRNRSWRLSFQEFEREMMKDRQQLKTTIRLVKKLRDALDMKAIASYYIKTIFLWKIDAHDGKYWQAKLSFLFLTMVKELYAAIEKKNIKYFWHKDNNLIETLKDSHQKIYLDKLGKVIKSIEANDVDAVITALLTNDELKEFQKSEFYQKFNIECIDVKDSPSPSVVLAKEAPLVSSTNLKADNNDDKFDELLNRIASLEERVKYLEMLTNIPHSQESTELNLIDYD